MPSSRNPLQIRLYEGANAHPHPGVISSVMRQNALIVALLCAVGGGQEVELGQDKSQGSALSRANPTCHPYTVRAAGDEDCRKW